MLEGSLFQLSRKVISLVLIISLAFSPTFSYAQSAFVSTLPEPGKMVNVSEAFTPILVKGLVIHPEAPLNFDFIVDSGNDSSEQSAVKEQSEKIVKYFLAAVTVPEDSLWVNLSPYEKDRIIDEGLGQTLLGRDMLAQDYVLKQLTASMIYPEDKLGKEFWAKVYKEAQEKFGTTDIPVDTFNKVWIVPEKAVVFEKDNAVYVTEAKLKVMLDSDYVAQARHPEADRHPDEPSGEEGSPAQTENKETNAGGSSLATLAQNDVSSISSSTSQELAKQLIREIVLPAIEREVNTGRNFATLRQVYYAAILAKWYRELVQDTLMSKGYVGQNKISGVVTDEKTLKEEIYQRYISAYKKGVFDLIKEEPDPTTGETIPRKYFSGGLDKFGDIKLVRAQNAGSIVKVGNVFQVDFVMNREKDSAMNAAELAREMEAAEAREDYEAYNRASDQLHLMGSPDGDYFYRYDPGMTQLEYEWGMADNHWKKINRNEEDRFRSAYGLGFGLDMAMSDENEGINQPPSRDGLYQGEIVGNYQWDSGGMPISGGTEFYLMGNLTEPHWERIDSAMSGIQFTSSALAANSYIPSHVTNLETLRTFLEKPESIQLTSSALARNATYRLPDFAMSVSEIGDWVVTGEIGFVVLGFTILAVAGVGKYFFGADKSNGGSGPSRFARKMDFLKNDALWQVGRWYSDKKNDLRSAVREYGEYFKERARQRREERYWNNLVKVGLPAVPELLKAERWHELSRMGDVAVSALVEALESAQPGERYNAISDALYSLGDVRARYRYEAVYTEVYENVWVPPSREIVGYEIMNGDATSGGVNVPIYTERDGYYTRQLQGKSFSHWKRILRSDAAMLQTTSSALAANADSAKLSAIWAKNIPAPVDPAMMEVLAIGAVIGFVSLAIYRFVRDLRGDRQFSALLPYYDNVGFLGNYMSFTADERRVLIAALVAPLEKVVLLNEEKESISRVLRTVLMQDLIKGNYATLEIVINAAVSSKLPEENRLLLRDALWTIDSIASIGQRSSGLDQGLKAFRKLLASASLSKPSGVRWETDAAMNGGININNIGVEKKSIGGKIQFNDAAMKAIFDSGFNGFTPVFIRMTPVESPLMILGVADQGMNASSG